MKKGAYYGFIILLIIYTTFVFLSYLNLISKYTLHFELFALILAILAIFTIKKGTKYNINKLWIILPLVLIILFRILPYLGNSIPLGYDTGIYKYIIEKYQQNLPSIPEYGLDNWIRGGFEHGLFVITDLIHLIGYSNNFILTFLLIFFELLLALILYATTKKYFDKNIGILSVFIFAISITQFKTFSYMYYKNIIALILLLTTLYLLNSKFRYLAILPGIMMAAIHRPTFLIFGLSFFVYFLLNLKRWKENFAIGSLICLLAIPFYIFRFKEIILNYIDPLIQANIGAGTFITFYQYQFLSLAYLPLAILGIFYLIREKKFNMLFLWGIINFILVYFQLVFFNRFVIHLDLIFIIFAALGFNLLIENKKQLGTVISIVLLISGLFLVVSESINAKPLINQEELDIIQNLSNTEENAYVMSTSSYYSTWILGYSNRKTIAPGLFDYDKWNLSIWQTFWNTTDLNITTSLLNMYQKPLYIFNGENSQINNTKFENKCFERINDYTYRYLC